MKLYTEEQVRKLNEDINLSLQKYFPKECYDMYNNNQLQYEQIFLIFQQLTPIELPTDIEIEEYAVLDFPFEDNIKSNLKNMLITDEMFGFEIGAKWMRDKIQGGNK